MDDDYQNMVIVGLEETITALKAERDSLLAIIHEAREIYIQLEGFDSKACPEVYLQQEMKKMYTALEVKGEGK